MWFFLYSFYTINMQFSLQCSYISIFLNEKEKDDSGAYSGLRTTDLSVPIILFKELIAICNNDAIFVYFHVFLTLWTVMTK